MLEILNKDAKRNGWEVVGMIGSLETSADVIIMVYREDAPFKDAKHSTHNYNVDYGFSGGKYDLSFDEAQRSLLERAWGRTSFDEKMDEPLKETTLSNGTKLVTGANGFFK